MHCFIQDNFRTRACRSHRRGSMLIYSFYIMIVMFAFVSFGVDFGHMQNIKTEMQRDADLTARASLQMVVSYGMSTAQAYAPYIASNSYNPVDAASGVQPTVTITWGSWDPNYSVFTAGGSGSITAVKIVVSRTAATNNPVKLTFPLINGLAAVKTSCDVWAQAIAILNTATSASATVSGLSDPWLAGMSSGSGSVSDGDTAPAESPPMVMNVTPGSTLTFTAPSGGSVTGGVKNDPSNATNDTADGNAAAMHSHNDDDPMNESAVQNNIGDIAAPINSLIGVFLGPNAPNTQPAPAAKQDYSTQASRDLSTYSNIQAQQPFFIGDGQTSGGTTQTFIVPAGMTRLYLGTMDGHQWSNNSGSYSVKVTEQSAILLVK